MCLILNVSYIRKAFLTSRKRLKKLIKLPLRIKGLLVEAFCLMGIARLAILLIPFRNVASVMGTQMAETTEHVDVKICTKAVEIGQVVQKMSSFTPWESKCLVQALTAQIMLKRRSIPSTLYLGMARDEKDRLIAHAWLRCGEMIITGGNVRSMFKAVMHFASHTG